MVPRGGFFALLGPSGCGKTTTLRMVAGLEQPTSGRVLIGDTDLTGSRPYERPVNTVFQSYAPVPAPRHRRQRGLRPAPAWGQGRGEARRPRRSSWCRWATSPTASRPSSPVASSSGSPSARALVNRPEVLLLDEPLGALDLKLRRQMQVELKRIQTEVGLTFIHVTHDQEEAMTMADTVAVMNAGRIEQMGPPAELYDLPRTAFVANFLGQSNLVRGTVVSDDGDVVAVRTRAGKVVVPSARATARTGDVVDGRAAGEGPDRPGGERAGRRPVTT